MSYEQLLLLYLQGVGQITITDHNIRPFRQARNLMEPVAGLAKSRDAADEIRVSLVRSPNDESLEQRQKQIEFLASIEQGATAAGITFEGTATESFGPVASAFPTIMATRNHWAAIAESETRTARGIEAKRMIASFDKTSAHGRIGELTTARKRETTPFQ